MNIKKLPSSRFTTFRHKCSIKAQPSTTDLFRTSFNYILICMHVCMNVLRLAPNIDGFEMVYCLLMAGGELCRLIATLTNLLKGLIYS